MKRIWFLLALLLFTVAISFLFIACDSTESLKITTDSPNDADLGEHVHAYSDLWTSDEKFHWHAASCIHDLIPPRWLRLSKPPPVEISPLRGGRDRVKT